MTKISKSKLSQLYSSDEIAEIWNANQHLAVIKHPQKGLISPNQYRTMAKEKRVTNIIILKGKKLLIKSIRYFFIPIMSLSII
jgi:hypothetical protein